ncbi:MULTISPECIES: DUF3576 domain-containing protein [unclassified Haematospirillum]|uniref:DUF3576 domain-containing protein n=1 Tax=unclassified Haematospirillum TaxID=2622088 RepID=UPI001FD7F55E|nr:MULTISPECIES: DUF3576 domain-containing protein [unclassified Haematospirillum]
MKRIDNILTGSSVRACRGRQSMATVLRAGLVAFAALTLTACQGTAVDSRPYEKRADGSWGRGEEERDTIFGKGGINLLGGKSKDEDAGGAGVAVNAFLWRASLDTVSFMPLSSADPFGGVIITDWYTPPETPNERFKVNVYILGRALRSDGLKVSVFRQERGRSGQWVDAAVAPAVTTEFENAVLTRARQLRSAAGS